MMGHHPPGLEDMVPGVARPALTVWLLANMMRKEREPS